MKQTYEPIELNGTYELKPYQIIDPQAKPQIMLKDLKPRYHKDDLKG